MVLPRLYFSLPAYTSSNTSPQEELQAHSRNFRPSEVDASLPSFAMGDKLFGPFCIRQSGYAFPIAVNLATLKTASAQTKTPRPQSPGVLLEL
jgi:hypothetical protein